MNLKDAYIKHSLIDGKVRLITEEVDGTICTTFLEVTHEVPFVKAPLLVRDPEGAFPQELLDALMGEFLWNQSAPPSVLWWQDYYKQRRFYKENHAEELRAADEKFREEFSTGGYHYAF